MTEMPNTVFGLMALIITVLVGVVVFQQRLIQKLYDDKSALQDKRLEDANLVRNRYDEVMGKFSQSFDLFVAKLDGEEHKR